jgi:GNAT superfamily N-acetyltransferase
VDAGPDWALIDDIPAQISPVTGIDGMGGMENILLRGAERGDYGDLARWIVELSQAPEQHCLHSWAGESADALCGQLLSYLDDAELSYVLAFRRGELIGAMGSEYDQELGRGWLHGPHVTAGAWEAIGAALFARLLAELPASIAQLDAYLNVANARGRRFYSERGFEERDNLSYDFWLTPADRVVSAEKRCGPLGRSHEASFIDLYQALFPGAYYSGERIVRMMGTSHQVLIADHGGDVIGFVIASVDQSVSGGEIQFLGVREDRRGQGHGRRLLLSPIDWLLEQAKVSHVCLNVGEGMVRARHLYESVGFKLQFTGVGLQRARSPERGY